MKIPSDAIIAREKLTQYLLEPQVKDDKSKFLAQAGFTQENPDELEKAIREMIATHEAVLDRQNQFGDFYRVEGRLRGIGERDLLVVTVWIIRTEVDNLYRFVTLKPWR